MFLISNIMGAILLTLEGYLAFLAFSGLPNSCTPDKEGEKTIFPCAVNKLFNDNFQDIPFVGPVV